MRLALTLTTLLLLSSRGRAQDEILTQWALSVVDASSVAAGTAGLSIQAVGAPNADCVLEAGETFESLAWRPGADDAGPEWIEVRFLTPVHATAVAVHQALNPGAVAAVSVRTPEGSLHEVWRGEDPTRSCPGVLEIGFPSLPFPTDAVRVELDTRLVSGPNQVDAIQLRGFPATGTPPLFAPIAAGAVGSPPSLLSFTFVDYDHDGWPDLFGLDVSGASDFTVLPPLVLLHNEGDGTFADRSALLPVRRTNTNAGRVFGDYDRDGDLDLYIPPGSLARSAAGRDILLRNDRGTFTEAAAAAGLTDSLISTAAIWWDYDRDGYLDLYIGHGDLAGKNRAGHILWHNDGDGTFTRATAAAGLDVPFHEPSSPFVAGSPGGFQAADFDDDGWPDLYVPVVGSPNHLFLNDRHGGFDEAAVGALRDATGWDLAPAVGDVDNDGALDIYQAVAGAASRSNRSFLLKNLGDARFLDVTDGTGLSASGPLTLLYAKLFDADNDGDLDLLGAVPFVLFLNRGDGTFVERTFRGGIGGAYAAADFDDDGFLDLSFDRFVYRNLGNDNHFLRVELVGTRSNRDAFGARLVATAGDLRQTRELTSGNGWIQDELTVHFGLGERTVVDELEIRWPSGLTEVFQDVSADRTIRVVEGRQEYWPVARTVWEVEPPAAVDFGRRVDFVAVARPALFEPGARITAVTADLGRLGGPTDVPLVDQGDGTWRLEAAFTVAGDSELRDVVVSILQETSVGTHWIGLSRNVAVTGAPVTAVREGRDPALPAGFALRQSYPNPFNPATSIRFDLPRPARVELEVFDISGQRVATLAAGPRQAGSYTVRWDGRDDRGRTLASGVYLYRLRADGVLVQTRRLTLLR